jgi:hypothetical protein
MRRLLPALSFNCSHPQILSAMVSATSLGPVQQLTYRTLVRPPAHPAPRHHLLAQGSFDDRYELPPPAPASSSQPAAVLTTSSLHAVGRDKVYRATQNAAKALAWCGSTSPPPSSDGVLIPRAVSRLPPQGLHRRDGRPPQRAQVDPGTLPQACVLSPSAPKSSSSRTSVPSVMRIGKPLEHAQSAIKALDIADPFLKYTAVGRQLGYAGYLLNDTLIWVSPKRRLSPPYYIY